MRRSLQLRLLTSLIGIPAALGVIFLLPGEAVFLVMFAVFYWAAFEFVRLARVAAPSAPLGRLLLLLPLAAGIGFWLLRQGRIAENPGLWLAAGASFVVLAAAGATLLSGVAPRDGLLCLGTLAFAMPYFALPPLALYCLKVLDAWLIIALLAIVWLGDSAAFFVGSRFGRRKLAPVVSPNKTWEGALASLAAAVLAMGAWSLGRLGEIRAELLVLAALTSVAAQLGDLLESLVKRGAGVKDSAHVLPGHGGFYDRLDALMLSAPCFVLGLWLLGFESVISR